MKQTVNIHSITGPNSNHVKWSRRWVGVLRLVVSPSAWRQLWCLQSAQAPLTQIGAGKTAQDAAAEPVHAGWVFVAHCKLVAWWVSDSKS